MRERGVACRWWWRWRWRWRWRWWMRRGRKRTWGTEAGEGDAVCRACLSPGSATSLLLTVLGRRRHLVGYLGLLSPQQRYAAALLRRQARAQSRLHHVRAVVVRVGLAAAAPDTLTAVAAQHLAARVARCDFAVGVLAPGVPALGL